MPKQSPQKVRERAPRKQSDKKVRKYEDKMRAEGFHRTLVWVRDTPERIEAVRQRAREVSEPDWEPE